MNNKVIFSSLLSIALLCAAWARPGPIDQATLKMREDILSRAHFIEVQRLKSYHEGYEVLATSSLDEVGSRELIAQFRRLPFERVTFGQCHEPGFALRLLDSDRNEVVTISLCWDCSNVQATYGSPQEFRAYREDFAAHSKRGLSFQRRLDRLVPKPAESPNQAMQRTPTCRDDAFHDQNTSTSICALSR